MAAAARAEPGENVWVCLRAEDVSLIGDERARPPEASNVISGVVKSLAFWGTQVRVTVDCGAAVTALTTRLVATGLGLRPGKPVRMAFSPHSLHLIPRGSGTS